MPVGVTRAIKNATNTIATAIRRCPDHREARCRNGFVAKARDKTKANSVIVLLLVDRCQKRAAALSARERSKFIPTWKRALADLQIPPSFLTSHCTRRRQGGNRTQNRRR